MTTQIYRIARVLAGNSPVARIHAINTEGHELRLEVPVAAAQEALPGRVLVLQWSLHDLPAAKSADTPPVERPAAEVPGPRDMAGNRVDEQFMILMAGGRQTAPEPAESSEVTRSESTERQRLAELLGLAPARPQS